MLQLQIAKCRNCEIQIYSVIMILLSFNKPWDTYMQLMGYTDKSEFCFCLFVCLLVRLFFLVFLLLFSRMPDFTFCLFFG